MAIPTKRHERSIVCYLDLSEIKALLAAPDPRIWLAGRDRALLALMIQTGVRVSSSTRLRVSDVHLGTGRHIRVEGKGTQETRDSSTARPRRSCGCGLTARGAPGDPLFPTRQGRPSAGDTVGLLISKYTDAAATGCPSLTANGSRRTP